MNLESLTVDVVVLVVVAGADVGVPGGAIGTVAADGCGVDGGTGTAAMSASVSGRRMVPKVGRR